MSSAPAPSPAKYEIPSRADDPIWDRLEDQIAWHDRTSVQCQRIYKRIKSLEILSAAAIPVLSAINISLGSPNVLGHSLSWTILILGALITILEGLIKLNLYQENWLNYRSTCEGLQFEKFAYIAKVGPYKDAPDVHALLAERVLSLISQENAKWASAQQHKVEIKGGGKAGKPTD
jgi:Protein of unknown function (DUF4231)